MEDFAPGVGVATIDAHVVGTKWAKQLAGLLMSSHQWLERLVLVGCLEDVEDEASFDLVVVDAPCSNSGVFSRRPEARYRYDKKHIDSLIELQREILQDARSVMQNKGYLLYATCSIDPAENASQLEWLVHHQRLELVSEKTTFPSGHPGSEPTKWHDGGFVALLKAR